VLHSARGSDCRTRANQSDSFVKSRRVLRAAVSQPLYRDIGHLLNLPHIRLYPAIGASPLFSFFFFSFFTYRAQLFADSGEETVDTRSLEEATMKSPSRKSMPADVDPDEL
jgi:hypothetical protein